MSTTEMTKLITTLNKTENSLLKLNTANTLCLSDININWDGAVQAALIPSNIKKGVTILGVTGTYSSIDPSTIYSITCTAKNCSYVISSGSTTIPAGGSDTITFTANDGYKLPDSITISGAGFTWDSSTGILSINYAYANVIIKCTAIREDELPTPNPDPDMETLITPTLTVDDQGYYSVSNLDERATEIRIYYALKGNTVSTASKYFTLGIEQGDYSLAGILDDGKYYLRAAAYANGYNMSTLSAQIAYIEGQNMIFASVSPILFYGSMPAITDLHILENADYEAYNTQVDIGTATGSDAVSSNAFYVLISYDFDTNMGITSYGYSVTEIETDVTAVSDYGYHKGNVYYITKNQSEGDQYYNTYISFEYEINN